MKVECPNCQTTYNLPDDRIGQDGASVRCSVCKHQFHVDAPTPEDFPGFGDSGAAPVWPVQGEDEADPVGDFASHLDAQRKKDPFVEPSLSQGADDEFSSTDFSSIDFGKSDKPAGGGLSRKMLLVASLLGVVLLAGIGGTAAYFFEFWPFAKKASQSAMEGAQPAPAKADAQQPQQAPPPNYLLSITIDKHSYYFTENDKIGKLLVIEGKMINSTPVIIGQVKIEATLRDAADAPVLTKTVIAGPKANNFELKTMNQNDLESRLNSVQEVLLNNGNVKPGEDIPFMFVFPNVPANVSNFTLKVAEYHEVTPPAGQPADKK